MSDTVIHVEGLSKQYRIGQREPYGALRDVLMETVRGKRRAAPEMIWALRDVSFEVKQGEVIGIIGRNGAGKSTLLKILSRVTKPTEGLADIWGRVGSLLEVGTGFHPELTGRENIYLNGAILGMRRAEIDRKFDEIVAFAETEQFLDTPVKHYSSGMRVRLAFAVAAHLEPEILLVDEVLAVGDAAFQKKCLGKMGDVAKGGRTILFVSHNMAAVNTLCPRSLWIDAGQIRQQGATEEVLAGYLSSGATLEGQRTWEAGFANLNTRDFQFRRVCLRDDKGVAVSKLDARKPFWIEIQYRVLERLPYCRIGFVLSTIHGISVIEAYDCDDARWEGPRSPGDYTIRCEIPGELLNVNRYTLSLNAGIPNVRNLAFVDGVLVFDLEDLSAFGAHVLLAREGVIRPRLRWEPSTTP